MFGDVALDWQDNLIYYWREEIIISIWKKEHECEICGECFGQEGNLSQHMDGVYLKKPHKCKQECGS